MTDEPEGEPEVEEELVEEMVAARSLPTAGFRGALARHLVYQDPGYGPRPQGLRLRAAGFLVPSALIMLLGLLQATGSL
jgi:hypothetical protein